jgi:phage gp36-like protein
MPYATLNDLQSTFGEAEIGQLLTRLSTGNVPATIAGRFLDDASAEIDSYLAVSYAVPVSPAPQSLRAVCCDIARYRMFDDMASETVRQRYDDACKWLGKLAAGKAILLTDAGVAAPPSTTDDTGTAGDPAGSTLTPIYGSAFTALYGDGTLVSGYTPF